MMYFHRQPLLPPLEFLSIEILYSVIVILLCILIYFKTKEVYDLSKHKGIKYFRNTFLFFGMAFFFRLIPVSLIFSRNIAKPLLQISLFLVSYFSILAILSLLSSIIWKKLDDNAILVKKKSRMQFLTFSSVFTAPRQEYPIPSQVWATVLCAPPCQRPLFLRSQKSPQQRVPKIVAL